MRARVDRRSGVALPVLTLAVMVLVPLTSGCTPVSTPSSESQGTQALPSSARPADPNDTVVSSATALTQVPSLSAAVPAGRLLQETERMSSPSVAPSEHRFLIDYAGQRMRFEGYVDGVLRFLDVNEGGITASLSTVGSSLRGHPRSFDEYETSHDFLAGLPVTRVSELSVDGQPADLYRAEFPNQGGEITAEYALIWVDTPTGLRFREKWMAGQEVVRVVTWRVVTPTPELGALLGRASVQASSVGGLESNPG